uniref:CDKN1A interacting zinc finger protein 1 n=1 Tax=Molossus molossus TaxID=27622 RepID=A0A7J8EC75_MOLMO|nr:CDKN1A interacting zinc finger protein 1 [Molossus molossus]
MFNQLQQHLQQQQQLLQLQQLLQQPPPQAPLPMAISRGLPQQQPQQQFLNLQGNNSASFLNGSVLQRALLLQQLQGLDQFAMSPATYDSTGLTMPTATLGNLRSFNLATPNLTAPSLTPPQLATPNLQQFFPQATQQSLLGPPPVRVPINPSKLTLSGRAPQKQAGTPSSTTPERKTMPMEDQADPPEGSEEAAELRVDTPDQDPPPYPDDIAKEKSPSAPEPESCDASEPPAKRSKSSEEPTEKRPPGQLQAKIQPQARMTAPKQTQTPELLPDTLEARVLPRFQPRVLQIQAQVQPQTQPQMPPVDAQVQPKLQKQAQTQTSPEHLVAQQAQPKLQKEAEPQKQLPEQPSVQLPVHPPDETQGQPQTQPQVPASEQAPVPIHSTLPETPPSMEETEAGLEEALPEPVGAQVSVEESQEELTSGLDVGECEKRAREMLRVCSAGGSLKVTILQSSDSRAFSTVSLAPGPRSSDSTSATPAAASPPSRQALQFFCYICRASCCSQQEFQDHMLGAQHQQRLGEIQHMSQACLLSLLPVPRDVLEREEEPPLRRWCNTCRVYYMGDLIQHRRTQDHKIAKQSLRPFCTICNRYFKTPRKFVEHVKSQGHKDKAKELKMLEKEIAGQDEDHFITVDAVGCFEDDEEEEEEEEENEEEEIEVEEEFCKQVRSRGISIEEWKDSETYNPNTAYGVDFMVPVMGYVCRICHKFYQSSSGAKLSHCKSLAHFENLQKYKKAKNPNPITRPVSRRCAITARNALTALFTSGSRSHTQPSTQDTTNPHSKVTTQPPQPQSRRSTRLKT